MDSVVFLSGTTRGDTLEGIGRSLADGFRTLDIELIEISLRDGNNFLNRIKSLNFPEVKFFFSFVSMGMDIMVQRDDGAKVDLWTELGIPFLSLHGDSPAYFFDRHVVRNSTFVTLYGFEEHYQLRKRLPRVHGPIAHLWPAMQNETPKNQIDFARKKDSTLIFLKNGKNPASLRKFWTSCLEPRLLTAIMDIATEIETHLDDVCGNYIDDTVTYYFDNHGFDMEYLVKLRLFFIAQLDDYARAVKCTKMAEALMDFPVEIRGNEWNHLDFTGKKVTYIDDCNYVRSIDLIRNSLGIIDMSPNTTSVPHDRVTRSYGAHTLCLTNKQRFLEGLPHQDHLSFQFSKECLQEKIAYILANKTAAVEMGVEVAEAYRRIHPTKQTLKKMLDYASLARLNRLPYRPAGSQDFFVWPPSQL